MKGIIEGLPFEKWAENTLYRICTHTRLCLIEHDLRRIQEEIRKKSKPVMWLGNKEEL